MDTFVNLGDVHNQIIDPIKSKDLAGPFLQFEDCGNIINYTNLTDPDGRFSSRWSINIKSKSSPKDAPWNVMSNLLTNVYTVGKTDAIVSTIKSQLGGKTIGEKYWWDGSVVKYTFILEGYATDFRENDETNKFIFTLLTGIKEDDVDQNSTLSFNVVNSMVGNHTLCLNYGFLTNIIAKGANKVLSTNNPYILSEYSSRIVHDKKLQLNYSEIQNVKSNIAAKIAKFKSLQLPDNFIDMLIKGTGSKRIINKVEKILKGLPDEFRNFYYATYIISTVSASEKNISFEIRSRKCISDYVKQH
jgi:hypothetical protein